MIRKFALLLLGIYVGGCSTHQPVTGTTIDVINTEMYQAMDGNNKINQQAKRRPPPSVSAAMMPSMETRVAGVNYPYQRRFDIAVKDVPAKLFLAGLVKDTPFSMAVSPEVTGDITLNLKKVTVEQVLKTLQHVYGYDYRRTAVGYEVLPNKIETKMFTVNYLELNRKGSSKMVINSGQVSQGAQSGSSSSGGSTSASSSPSTSSIGDVETSSTVDFWRQLNDSLVTMIGTEGGRSVSVNPLAGVVIVRAYPRELKQVASYLDAIQNNMDRQVIIEAKILEVQLNDDYQMGIDWRIFGARLNALSDFEEVGISNITFPNAFQTVIQWNPLNFTSTIRALGMQGNVQVLSSPRVSTMNNQKAVIKVGNDEFFVTNVSTSSTATATTTIPTQDVELTPFFSGISLDVTPQIDARDNVTLHIHPSVSQVDDQRKTIDLGVSGVLVLPLAQSTIRESDTIVHARNGEVVVIGGLMKNQSQESIAQLPFFGNIPFLGTLLRNTKQTNRKSELVILLRPMVIKKSAWNKELNSTQQRVKTLKRGFHFGSRPELFGTEGERPFTIGPKSGTYRHPA